MEIKFILESLLFAAVSCILAVGLVQLLMPAYTSLLGYKLPSYWTNPYLYVFILGVIVVVGLLAGSYPALLLSSFSPIESLKGKMKVGKNGAFFRKTLVVVQFGISVLLIIAITIILSQMQYVKNADLGFSREQSMIVRLDNKEIGNNKVQFKQALQHLPAVQSVSLMSGEPGGFHDFYNFETQGKPDEKLMFNTEYSDFEYAKTLGLKIIAGRDLSPQYGADSNQSVIVTRLAAAKMGYTPEQAIGKWVRNINRDTARRTIVGVLEDFHYVSLKEPMGPLIVSTNDDRRLALIRLKTDRMSATVDEIRKSYLKVAPSYPFEFEFLDEKYSDLYRAESRQESILTIFSTIAIFIACLGLFGLASYTAIKRTKEIGVRKVLGSSIQNIVMLLSKDLIKPVFLGTLIAVPIGYYFMSKWLDGFAYRIHMQWWMFVTAAAIAVMIALATVSFQAVKAAVANPINSLRSE